MRLLTQVPVGLVAAGNRPSVALDNPQRMELHSVATLAQDILSQAMLPRCLNITCLFFLTFSVMSSPSDIALLQEVQDYIVNTGHKPMRCKGSAGKLGAKVHLALKRKTPPDGLRSLLESARRVQGRTAKKLKVLTSRTQKGTMRPHKERRWLENQRYKSGLQVLREPAAAVPSVSDTAVLAITAAGRKQSARRSPLPMVANPRLVVKRPAGKLPLAPRVVPPDAAKLLDAMLEDFIALMNKINPEFPWCLIKLSLLAQQWVGRRACWDDDIDVLILVDSASDWWEQRFGALQVALQNRGWEVKRQFTFLATIWQFHFC